MHEQFTYTSLSSLTGAVVTTVLIVQFLKEFGPPKQLPTRWLVLAVAEGIAIINIVTIGKFVATDIPLYFLNGLLVAASAMGSWQILHDNLSGDLNKQKRKFFLFSKKSNIKRSNRKVNERKLVVYQSTKLPVQSGSQELKPPVGL